MAIIATLAGMLTGVILYARNLSIRVQCQQNLHQIGEAVSLLVLNNSGLCPIGPAFDAHNNPRTDGLANAYPQPQNSDANPSVPNNSGFPWWARVFEQMEGDMGLLFAKNAAGVYATNGLTDAGLNPNGHVLTAQLPQTMNIFHCRMAPALDGASVVNLFNSISYGINFDVKDAGYLAAINPPTQQSNPSTQQRPYCASSWTGPLAQDPYSQDFPNNLKTPEDKYPDQYSANEIQNPGTFILISEACVLDTGLLPKPFSQALSQAPLWNSTASYVPSNIVSDNGLVYTCTASNIGCEPTLNPNDWKLGYWTGGRISMGDTTSNQTGYERTSADSPQYNVPIVGRHSGYANVLFADWHVEAIQIIPGQTSATPNINYNTPFWTLPGK